MFAPDKSKFAGVNADPFSLEALIAWIAKQPQAKEYNYTCNGHCLIAQYMKTLNIGFKECDSEEWWGKDRVRHPLPPHFDDVAVGTESNMGKTFGAALSRALAIQSGAK